MSERDEINEHWKLSEAMNREIKRRQMQQAVASRNYYSQTNSKVPGGSDDFGLLGLLIGLLLQLALNPIIAILWELPKFVLRLIFKKQR